MKLSLNPYSVYIITNKTKTVLYTGVTNDLTRRLIEHYLNAGKLETFAGKYRCHFLVYYEDYQYINDAIAREKEIKKWSRRQKEALINSVNPNWDILNYLLFEKWPPNRRDYGM